MTVLANVCLAATPSAEFAVEVLVQVFVHYDVMNCVIGRVETRRRCSLFHHGLIIRDAAVFLTSRYTALTDPSYVKKS